MNYILQYSYIDNIDHYFYLEFEDFKEAAEYYVNFSKGDTIGRVRLFSGHIEIKGDIISAYTHMIEE